MIAFPHAKINLGLSVVSKRPDGFHNLETIFYPIPLHDVLEIVPAEKTSFIPIRTENSWRKKQITWFCVHINCLKEKYPAVGTSGNSPS